jgi:hypothetical protein
LLALAAPPPAVRAQTPPPPAPAPAAATPSGDAPAAATPSGDAPTAATPGPHLPASPALAVPDPTPAIPPAPVTPESHPGVAAPSPVGTTGTAGTAGPTISRSMAAPPEPGFFESLVGGKVAADLRYRYEYLSDDAISEYGQASTIRGALGYETKPFYGFSVMGQLLGVGNLGEERYSVPTVPDQNRMQYPVIVDPKGYQLAQAYAKYASPLLTVRLGRQEVALNNGRLVSVSTWRQVHQALDAAYANITPIKDLSLTYAYVFRVNRTVSNAATDGQLDMNSHLINLTYKRPGQIGAAAYGVLLDYKTAPANSRNTFGARIEGPYSVSETVSVLYAAELAYQLEAGSNPNNVSAKYYLAEVGLAWRGFGLRAQYNVRDGHGATNKFLTPLSNPWDGWTEKFATTPDNGMRTAAAMLSGPVPKLPGLNLSAAYYEYWGQSTSAHYGQEFDAGLEYRLVWLSKDLIVGNRFAYYKADTLFAATLRASIYTAYSF